VHVSQHLDLGETLPQAAVFIQAGRDGHEGIDLLEQSIGLGLAAEPLGDIEEEAHAEVTLSLWVILERLKHGIARLQDLGILRVLPLGRTQVAERLDLVIQGFLAGAVHARARLGDEEDDEPETGGAGDLLEPAHGSPRGLSVIAGTGAVIRDSA